MDWPQYSSFLSLMNSVHVLSYEIHFNIIIQYDLFLSLFRTNNMYAFRYVDTKQVFLCFHMNFSVVFWPFPKATCISFSLFALCS
jgi:hypothetical protein